MTDWPAIHRRVWAAIQASDQGLDGLTLAFARQLTKQLRADGYALGTDAQAAIAAYIEEVRAALSAGLAQALEPMATAAAGGALASDFIREQTATAFSERWPDGLSLSDRVWRWDQATRNGITDTLRDGIARGASMGRMVMDLQRKIESGTGERFSISGPDAEDWISDLHDQARSLIHGKVPLESWLIHMEGVREHLTKLKTTGTQHAARQAVDRIRTGVKEGSDELLDDALKWWVYDRQLYRLQRIARTEMATAAHRGVIAATKDDDDIIGYHWRLSRSHPEPDICDYYAGIELGLGRGVWPVDQVPEHKAHPQCMCTLVPRVRPVPERGDVDLGSFIEAMGPTRARQILPGWARRLHAIGMPLNSMLRQDGMWLASKSEVRDRIGENRHQALQALGIALDQGLWKQTIIGGKPKNMRINKSMARNNLREFDRMRLNAGDADNLLAVQEVAEMVGILRRAARAPRSQYPRVESGYWHYWRRRYIEGETLRNPSDMQNWVRSILRDPHAQVMRERGDDADYAVYSERERRVVIIQPDGRIVTTYFVYPETDPTARWGHPLWTIHALTR